MDSSSQVDTGNELDTPPLPPQEENTTGEALATPHSQQPLQKVVKPSKTPVTEPRLDEQMEMLTEEASSLLSFANSPRTLTTNDLHINEQFQRSSLVTTKFLWTTDAKSELNKNGSFTLPLDKFLYVFMSKQLQYLSARQISPTVSGTEKLPRFSVHFLKPKGKVQSTQSLRYRELLLSHFQESFPTREVSLIKNAVYHATSTAIFVTAKKNDNQEIVVSGLTFSIISSEKLVISMAATSNQSYDNAFGSGNDNKSFQRRGLMSFLLHLSRLYLYSMHGTPNVILYAAIKPNDSSRQLFFKKLGFTFMSATLKVLSSLFSYGDKLFKRLPFCGDEFLYLYHFALPDLPFAIKDKPMCGEVGISLGSCGCNTESHSSVHSHIRCIFCGELTHIECCHRLPAKPAWEQLQALTKKYTRDDLLPAGFPKLPITWTICLSCSSETMFLPGRECAANNEDKSVDIGPTYHCFCGTKPVHKGFTCSKCNRPMHLSCGIYTDPSDEFFSHGLYWHWKKLPMCLCCAGSTQEYAKNYSIVSAWKTSRYPRSGETVLEHPFPLSFQDFATITDKVFKDNDAGVQSSTTSLFKSVTSTAIDAKKRKSKNLLVRNDPWIKNDNYMKNPAGACNPTLYISRLTTVDERLLHGEDKMWFTPNIIDFFISLVNSATIVGGAASSKNCNCLPLPMITTIFQTFQQSGRHGIYNLCLSAKATITQFLFATPLVLLPFLHPHLNSFGLAILRNRGQKTRPALFVIDYCEQDGFNSCRANYVIGTLLRDFIDIASMMNKKSFSSLSSTEILQSSETYFESNIAIPIKRLMTNPTSVGIDVHDNVTHGSFLCHDMLEFLRDDSSYRTVVLGVSIFQTPELILGNPDDDASATKPIIELFVKKLRIKFAPKYISKLLFSMSLDNLHQDGYWSMAPRLMATSVETLRYCVRDRGENGACDLEQKMFGNFVVSLLYIIARQTYEQAVSSLDMLVLNKVNNKCAECNKLFLGGWCQTRDLCLPTAKSFPSWRAMTSVTPLSLFAQAMHSLDVHFGTIRCKKKEFPTFCEYLHENHPRAYDECLSLPNKYEDMIYWELVQVTTTLELALHKLHKENIYDNLQFLSTSKETMTGDMYRDQSVKLTVDKDTNKLLVTCLDQNHHFLVLLDMDFRRAIYYDGMDSAAFKAVELGPERYEEINLDLPPTCDGDERSTLEYVDVLLDYLGLHEMTPSGDRLPVQFVRNHASFRTQDTAPTLEDPWQVVSAVLVDENWASSLIIQQNNHACGPVTIVQLLHLIKVDVGFDKFGVDSNTNFAAVLTDYPQLPYDIYQFLDECVDGVQAQVMSEWAEYLNSLPSQQEQNDGDGDDGAGNKEENKDGGETGQETGKKAPENSAGNGGGSGGQTGSSDPKPKEGGDGQDTGGGNGPNNGDSGLKKARSVTYPGSRKRKEYSTKSVTEVGSKRLYSEKNDWSDFQTERTNITTDEESLGSDSDNEENVESLADWRFPKDNNVEADVNHNMMIQGLPIEPEVSYLEIADSFPFINYLRRRRERRSNTVIWEARLPGMRKHNYINITDNVVVLIFLRTFQQRMERSENQWVRVLYHDYSFDGIEKARAETNMMEEMFYGGGSKFLSLLRHVRFSDGKWLLQQTRSTIRCYKYRGAPEGVVVMVPRNPYWYGEIFLPGRTSDRDVHFTHRLSQRWVYDMFTEVMVSVALQKSGQGIVVVGSESNDWYNQLISEGDANLSEVKRRLKKTEMGLVQTKKQKVEEAQVTHCLFRRKDRDRPGMEYWIEKKLELPVTWKNDCKSGWFFVLTKDSPKMGEIESFQWIRSNFHKGYITLLMQNQGQWLRVPAGRRQKRTRRDIDCKLQHDYTTTNAETSTVSYRGVEYFHLKTIGSHWPRIRFRQAEKETCIVSSMANALACMGFKRTAAMLEDQANASMKKHTNKEKIDIISSILQKHEPALLKRQPVVYKKGLFRPLDMISCHPTLLILQSVDGDSHHAVTVYQNWIFDASEEHALPICIEALNRCAKPGLDTVLYAVRYFK